MARKADSEFQEIGHCGGQFIVKVRTSPEGQREIQVGIHHSRPTAASFFALYILPQGIPLCMIRITGIGGHSSPPPTRDALMVFVASDALGMFGHQCPNCKGYWRSDAAPAEWRLTCVYCGFRAPTHNFLTPGQTKYVNACSELIAEAVNREEDGEVSIDMDVVADAVGKDVEKPKLYYAEESQQNKYKCSTCGARNDILGRYGYCCSCGSHNGLHELEQEISQICDRIATGDQYKACAKDAVSAFDSYARQIAKQISQRVPMTPARQKCWQKKLFHNLKPRAEELRTVFDIDPFKGLSKQDVDFAVCMFHRRHVYEHNGGEVDEKYIQDSGDTSVRPKQVIHESKKSATRIAQIVPEMAANIHRAFHLIFPCEERPISIHVGERRQET